MKQVENARNVQPFWKIAKRDLDGCGGHRRKQTSTVLVKTQ
ncbi:MULTISPECIES: hypothetical protein [Desertifilum]|uniref:Uncharacterized protein n=1 Tax=Desertifilum tharense IPPAS B-1220 TaxID=1781255 RepID=A0ACD5GVV1_9CYAN|nr:MULTISPECIES: hypothetical protein [Desertifilum]MDA0208981.1 hypothetical protein [Cyanobacteria bacterium FC1]